MNIKTRDKKPPREVRKLPKRAVEGEVIFNKADGFFYMGVRTKEDKYGGNMAETGV
jgi:hypothetical protein